MHVSEEKTKARSVSLIILAAGQGTRMNSDLPKVLHKVGAAPLLHHAMQAGRALDPETTIIVTGHGAEAVARSAHAFDDTAKCVVQEEQKGTAHAVLQAAPVLQGVAGDALVLYGDTPFIRPETLEAMLAARRRHAVVVLGFHAADPGRYGRLIADGDTLHRIVEWKDATEDERAITLCNSGVLCADAATLIRLCAAVGNDNASGEYYLPDVVALARDEGLSAGVILCDASETMGVNTRAQLAQAEAAFQCRARAELLDNGVTLTAPETVFLALDTHIGRDAIIGPNVIFGPEVTIEPGAEVKGFCHLEGCHVSRGAHVGPFARLRPGAELARNAGTAYELLHRRRGTYPASITGPLAGRYRMKHASMPPCPRRIAHKAPADHKRVAKACRPRATGVPLRLRRATYTTTPPLWNST